MNDLPRAYSEVWELKRKRVWRGYAFIGIMGILWFTALAMVAIAFIVAAGH